METDLSETSLPLFGLEANNYLQVPKTNVFFALELSTQWSNVLLC